MVTTYYTFIKILNNFLWIATKLLHFEFFDVYFQSNKRYPNYYTTVGKELKIDMIEGTRNYHTKKRGELI